MGFSLTKLDGEAPQIVDPSPANWTTKQNRLVPQDRILCFGESAHLRSAKQVQRMQDQYN